MKLKLNVLFSFLFFWACAPFESSNESANGEHKTENVIARIESLESNDIRSFSARILQGDVSPFDSTSFSRVEVQIRDSLIEFKKPSGNYWIEVVSDSDPQQVHWSFIDADEAPPSILQLEEVANVTAYYPSRGLEIVAIGIGGTDLVAEPDEFGYFHLNNLPPGTHECLGKAKIISDKNQVLDSIVYLGSFRAVAGNNLITEGMLF